MAVIESGAGIAEGGKTGLTAMVCGLCFVVSMFFAPIFASIPPWATGCTLILVSHHHGRLQHLLNSTQVGCLMMRQISSVNWSYIGDAIPAFVTVMFIPFGYSAAYGLIAGLMVYTALIYLTKLISCGSIVPDDEDRREYWTSRFHITMILRYPTLTLEPVKPHGKLPWFYTASQALALKVRGRRDRHRGDVASNRCEEDEWEYQDRLGSKASNQDAELERVVIRDLPRNPQHEKVLRM
jgi:AGZA family xanthine/uracil permease-like MFS transporter